LEGIFVELSHLETDWIVQIRS